MVVRVDQGRVKGREVRTPVVKFSLEGAERSINTEPSHHDDNRKIFQPPGVAPQRAAQTSRHCRAAAFSQTSPPRVNRKLISVANEAQDRVIGSSGDRVI